MWNRLESGVKTATQNQAPVDAIPEPRSIRMQGSWFDKSSGIDKYLKIQGSNDLGPSSSKTQPKPIGTVDQTGLENYSDHS